MPTIVGIAICFDAPRTIDALARLKRRTASDHVTAMIHGLGALAPIQPPREDVPSDLPSAYVLRESLSALGSARDAARAARIMSDSERLQERLHEYERMSLRIGQRTRNAAFAAGSLMLASMIAGAIITAMNEMTATSTALAAAVLLCQVGRIAYDGAPWGRRGGPVNDDGPIT